jgi:hypothetical protein
LGERNKVLVRKFVKPYRKSNQNDFIDVEAIAEAVSVVSCLRLVHDSSEWFVEARLHNRSERALSPCSRTPQESQLERCEHLDDSNIQIQPFPESVSEESEIYTDYDGCHRHDVKHDSYMSTHFSSLVQS